MSWSTTLVSWSSLIILSLIFTWGLFWLSGVRFDSFFFQSLLLLLILCLTLLLTPLLLFSRSHSFSALSLPLSFFLESLLLSLSFKLSSFSFLLSLSFKLFFFLKLLLSFHFFPLSSDLLFSSFKVNLLLSFSFLLLLLPLFLFQLFLSLFSFESLLYFLCRDAFSLGDSIDLLSPLLLLIFCLGFLGFFILLIEFVKKLLRYQDWFIIISLVLIHDLHSLLILLLLANAQSRLTLFVSLEELDLQILGEEVKDLVAPIESSDMQYCVAVVVLTFIVYSFVE